MIELTDDEFDEAYYEAMIHDLLKYPSEHDDLSDAEIDLIIRMENRTVEGSMENLLDTIDKARMGPDSELRDWLKSIRFNARLLKSLLKQ